MDTKHRPERDGAPDTVSGESLLWLLPLLGLVAWQGWMTLGLFGPDDPWEALRDARPILSGRHPLHLYHGYLGAHAFLHHGSTSCYDPSFQAGYPKTPVFDGGSRPAELFLSLAGGEYRPDVYKIGLAAGCLLVPVVLVVASRGTGLSRRAVFLAVVLGLMVWWGRPCQTALRSGDFDLLLAGQAALVLSGLLIRFDRKPGGRCWLGLFASGFLGWLFHPLLLALLMPLFLIYYLSVGARHRMIWSVLLMGGCFLAVGANYFWLCDWVDYWWLRVPLGPGELLLPHRTVATLWRASLWGEQLDRAMVLLLLGLGGAGAVLLHRRGDRPAARVLGLGSVGLVTLAVGGVMNELLGKFNATDLLVPGLLFAVPLAAHALDRSWRKLRVCTGRSWLCGAAVSAALGGLLLVPDVAEPITRRCMTPEPFPLGLSAAQQKIVEVLEKQTTTSARILWETPPRCTVGAGWTTLLPLLTGRYFVGGLDPGCGIEHMTDGLSQQNLGIRPLAECSDEDLADYCRRYNIGWVVCWTKPTTERFSRWSAAERIARLGSDGEGTLLAIRRTHSYVLEGKARWLGAEMSRIRLADVVPNKDGEVLLSLHYQEGLCASPARVEVERDKRDPNQDIPFIRLKVNAPVAHLTLIWQK
jgi:hypothetical protein